MSILLINSEVSNIGSWKRILHENNFDFMLSNELNINFNAVKKIIFPGVGNFGKVINNVKRSNLNKIIPDLKKQKSELTEKLKTETNLLKKLEFEDTIREINAKIKKTDRYKKLNKAGKTLEEIITIFNDTVRMKVFSWNGEIDTTLSPLDSIKYYTS